MSTLQLLLVRIPALGTNSEKVFRLLSSSFPWSRLSVLPQQVLFFSVNGRNTASLDIASITCAAKTSHFHIFITSVTLLGTVFGEPASMDGALM